MITRGMLAATALAMWAPTDALACGGFFCGNTPVEQSGENIVFAIDEDAREVTMHVQINYQGSAEDFAWVVPVAQEPQLFVSTEQLFTELAWRSAPRFDVQIETEGTCSGSPYYGGYYSDYDLDSDGYSSPPQAGGVTVVSQQAVGPYDTVVLQASSSAALLSWLQDNAYNLPDTLDPALQPYIGQESYFVALRLQNDRDVGDLTPLGLTYAGTKASIPIQLTSIAATPDMRVRTWILSDARAVPESYLHVHINHAAIDWTQRGDNYEAVVTRAADEAGGHAFATDYAGPADIVQESLWWDGRYDTEALAELEDPVQFMNGLIRQGFPADSTLLNLLQEFMPPPEGVDPASFYNCVQCYPDHVAELEFDAPAFAAALQELVVDPLIAAESMLGKHTWLTRMTSSVSPIEMTVDPVFVLNRDMGAQDNQHEAVVTYLCPTGETYYEAKRRLTLPDGRVMHVPSDEWLDDRGLTYEEWVDQQVSYYAVRIEQTGATGEPVLVSDYSNEPLPGSDPVPSEDAAAAKGCGCRSAGLSSVGGLWLIGLIGLLRRRQ